MHLSDPPGMHQAAGLPLARPLLRFRSMTNLLLLGTLLLAAPSIAPPVQMADGRTAWLLEDGTDVQLPVDVPVDLEVRFHFARAGCDPRSAKLEVYQDGIQVAVLEDQPPEGFLSWYVMAGYEEFDTLATQPVRFDLPVARESTVLRLTGSCGASITASR